jgi:hypothetical protein
MSALDLLSHLGETDTPTWLTAGATMVLFAILFGLTLVLAARPEAHPKCFPGGHPMPGWLAALYRMVIVSMSAGCCLVQLGALAAALMPEAPVHPSLLSVGAKVSAVGPLFAALAMASALALERPRRPGCSRCRGR